jgi:serine/threonine protein kinase
VVSLTAYEDEQAPRKLGRYEIIRRIAVGGMAEIFLARSAGLEGFEKLVVVKRILPQHAESHEFVTMFLDEARLVAGLSHPNIAQVYDIGLDDSGSYFFAMEFVDGEDVRQILRGCARRQERLPVAQAVSIGIGIAAGLHAAHERRGPDGRLLGIVHRDVSPSNVLVTYDGCVKLVDFGIAKAAGRQHVTRTGVLKGKCAYMSPEQTQGLPLDRRSDVFAIGILLYELTTGQRPFRGDNEYTTMRAIVSSAPEAPSASIKGYPKELEKIILRALAKDPNDRFASARALQVELERFARAASLEVSPVELADFMQALFADKLEPPSRPEPGQSLQLSRVLRSLTHPPSDVEPPREPKTRAVSSESMAGPLPVRKGSAPMNLTSVSLQLPRQPSVFSLTEELADTPTQVIERRVDAADTIAEPRSSKRRVVIVAGLAAALILAGAALAGKIAGTTSAGAARFDAGAARGNELPAPAAPPLAARALADPVIVAPAGEVVTPPAEPAATEPTSTAAAEPTPASPAAAAPAPSRKIATTEPARRAPVKARPAPAKRVVTPPATDEKAAPAVATPAETPAAVPAAPAAPPADGESLTKSLAHSLPTTPAPAPNKPADAAPPPAAAPTPAAKTAPAPATSPPAAAPTEHHDDPNQ